MNLKNNFRSSVIFDDLFFTSFCTKKYHGVRKLILNGNYLIPTIRFGVFIFLLITHE